jgi:hypothetical protein
MKRTLAPHFYSGDGVAEHAAILEQGLARRNVGMLLTHFE